MECLLQMKAVVEQLMKAGKQPSAAKGTEKEKAAGDSRLWLVVAAHDTDTNLVRLAAKLGYGKIVLRFGDA